MRWYGTIFLLAVTMLLVGCGASGQDVQELKSQQRLILAKLRDMEKKIDRVAAGPAPAAQNAANRNAVYDLPAGKSPVRGPANAPVTIVEFSDFQCPFCGRAEPLVEQVLKAYPDKVRLVYKNFPLTSIHPWALGAAKAAVAAAKQGKYWQMHDILFANQTDLRAEKLKEYAAKIGLDVPRWEKDMNSPQTDAAINADMELANSARVRGTPTFFVNGREVEARSFQSFKTMIDAALQKDNPASKT